MSEFESKVEVPENVQRLKGTSDMPEPEVLTYENMYKVSNVFKNDLKIILDELPYVDAKKFYDVLASNKDVLPAAILSQFIRNLGLLPYKYVAPMMKALEKKEAFDVYFQLVKK